MCGKSKKYYIYQSAQAHICPSEGSLNTHSTNGCYGAISGALMEMKTSARSQTLISGDKSLVRELL